LSEFNKQKEEQIKLAQVPAEKAARLAQGLPISTRLLCVDIGLPISTQSNRAEPTMLGNMIRTPLKLAADVLSNVDNALNIATGRPEVPVHKSNY
ncbi:hypothetical protein, partial [Listeria monocytogenes]|uniref:hypothetical protein n=1 Tax=Listeria monocytogenes TaxID=1639 RepID=UPI002FDBE42C